MKKKKSDLLTEVELEFMNELWALEEGTVRDVLERLPEDRNLAYTSGATILRILEQKEFVTSRKEGKSHVYKAMRQAKCEHESLAIIKPGHLRCNLCGMEVRLNR